MASDIWREEGTSGPSLEPLPAGLFIDTAPAGMTHATDLMSRSLSLGHLLSYLTLVRRFT